MCSDSGDAPFNISNTVELLSKRKLYITLLYLTINQAAANMISFSLIFEIYFDEQYIFQVLI